jgi:MraZ protein
MMTWRAVTVFLGTYEHSMDEKGRLVLPRKHRDLLEEGCIITKGLDRCLFVFSLQDWEQEYERLKALPRTDRRARQLQRSFFAGADNVTLDKQGRIPIPEKLRHYASLAKDVTVVGNGDHIEIWSTSMWEGEETEADEYYSGIEEVLNLERDSL